MANEVPIQEVTEENKEVWAALQPPPAISVAIRELEDLKDAVAESAWLAEEAAGCDQGDRPADYRYAAEAADYGVGSDLRSEGRAEAYRIVEGFVIAILQRARGEI